MIKHTSEILECLTDFLANVQTDSKDIFINYSSSSYALNLESQDFQNLQIDYQKNIIIFCNSIWTGLFSKKHPNITITDSYEQVCKMMREDINKSTYVYITSNLLKDDMTITEYNFSSRVVQLLKKYIGKIILEINPFHVQNFENQFKNLIHYFNSLYGSKIREVQSKIPKARYAICDLKTGEEIFHQKMFKKLKSQTIQKINLSSIIKQIKDQKSQKNLLIATNNPRQTLQKYRQQLQCFQEFEKNQNNIKYLEIMKQMRIFFQINSTRFNKIYHILENYGVLCCCQNLDELQIEQLKLKGEFKEDLFNQPIEKNDDDEIIFTNKKFYQFLLAFASKNISQFPIIMTNNPFYLLQGRGLTFQNFLIQNNFYQSLQKQQFLQIALKRIVFRENNKNNQYLMFTFTDNEQLLQFAQKIIINKKFNIPWHDMPFPWSIQQQFSNLNNLKNFSYEPQPRKQQKQLYFIYNIQQKLFIKYFLRNLKTNQIVKLELHQTQIKFKKFIEYMEMKYSESNVCSLCHNNFKKYFKSPQIYKQLNSFSIQQISQLIQQLKKQWSCSSKMKVFDLMDNFMQSDQSLDKVEKQNIYNINRTKPIKKNQEKKRKILDQVNQKQSEQFQFQFQADILKSKMQQQQQQPMKSFKNKKYAEYWQKWEQIKNKNVFNFKQDLSSS